MGGEGIFVKELEDALLDRRIDMAVHSLKDMPTTIPDGLRLASVSERVDPRDVLVSRFGKLAELPSRAKIGTGSQRRAVQILSQCSDIQVCDVRGNIDTRLGKVFSGQLDGVVLAAAALIRLGLEGRITEYLPVDSFMPAVGQGALGIEIRAEDAQLAEIVASINHEPTWQSIAAERAFLKALGGGCRAPIAALGTVANGTIHLRGMVASPSGSGILWAEVEGSALAPEEVGNNLARRMTEMGAVALIERAKT